MRSESIEYDTGDGIRRWMPGRWDCAAECYLHHGSEREGDRAMALMLAGIEPGAPGGRPYDWQRDG